MNQSYCSLAWVGITTDPDGSLRPCCVSDDKVTKDDGSLYNLGVDKLEDIYNSNFYKNLRQDMLDGKLIPGCKTCYSNEKYGRESRRLINNSLFANIEYTETTAEVKIQYLDMRLGNQCNLKCRMCSPMNSSMVEEEFEQNPDPVLDRFYLKSEISVENWFETETFDNNINPHLSNIVTLYMTGGEPTLIKKNYDIMQRLIDNGQHDKLTLVINTNMTNTNPKFYALLKQFKKVIIQMSIDAVDDLAYYIRYPTDFKVVDKTIHDLLSLGDNIILRAGPVIQTLNLNKLVDLFEYCENINKKYKRLVIDIRPGFVFLPAYNDITYLPKQYKMDCFRKIYMWMMQNCKYQSPQFKNTINALKGKCYEDNFDIGKIKDFLAFNTALDNIRNMKLQDYNKELYNAIKIYE
jgi:MoaA/NifB/PqqE/SkfB family radical SAM enzyme